MTIKVYSQPDRLSTDTRWRQTGIELGRARSPGRNCAHRLIYRDGSDQWL